MSSMLVRHPKETKPPALKAGGFASRCFSILSDATILLVARRE